MVIKPVGVSIDRVSLEHLAIWDLDGARYRSPGPWVRITARLGGTNSREEGTQRHYSQSNRVDCRFHLGNESATRPLESPCTTSISFESATVTHITVKLGE